MLIKVYPLHLTFVLPDGSLKEGIFDQGLRIPDCLVILDIKAKLDYRDDLNLGQLGLQNNQEIIIPAPLAQPEPELPKIDPPVEIDTPEPKKKVNSLFSRLKKLLL